MFHGDFSGALAIFMTVFQAGVIILILGLMYQIHRLQKQKNALLQEKDLVFNFVYDIGEVFADSDSVDLAALLKRVLSYALRTTNAGAGAIYLLASDDETLHAEAVVGVFPPLSGEIDDGIDTAFSKIRYVERIVRRQDIKVGEGLIGEVVAQGVPVLVPHGPGDPRVPVYAQDFLQLNSLLLVPMRFRHKVIGVVAVVNRTDGQPFSRTDMDLMQALADQASVAIHYAKFSNALDDKRRLDYDLGIAKKIQAALLPRVLPDIEGVEIGAFSVPAQQIGGDYYDFVQVDDDHLGIVIADVSGKGVSGAIVMSLCRSVLRVKAAGNLSPASVLKQVNRVLCPDLSEGMFISILYMVLNMKKHELVVARAGHLYPVLNSGVGQPWQIESKGMAMGFGTPDMFDAALEEKSVWLKPGDMVVAYTDGVTEAQDRLENEWGLLNLMKATQASAFEGESATKVADNIHQQLLEFVGDTAQYDDMTLMVLRTVK
ncbi:MAG: hypothetical protein C0404_00375 [Verrucomicrobia bacterium]|nr:hypothetical protein [Verrucomicrobiota bacterium]